MDKNCRKCNGTGYLPHLSRVDGGRCWACVTVRPAADPADDEAYAQILAELRLPRAERKALRAAREANKEEK